MSNPDTHETDGRTDAESDTSDGPFAGANAGDTDGDAAPAGEPESVATLADQFDAGDVWDTDHEDVGIFELTRHRNGDETVLLLCSFGDGWQVIAVEVDAAGELLETEVAGSATDYSRAVSMCEYWLDQNPKGILGGEPEDEGVMASIMRLFGGDA